MKHIETRAIRTQTERSQHREHSTPIFATSSFVFDDAEQARALFAGDEEGNVYSRYSNPTVDEFVHKLCALEGTEAGVATASGMSAMFYSMIAFLNQGDHIVASRALFGSTYNIITKTLPRWGIEYSIVDPREPETWGAAFKPNTKMLFIETPSNPGLSIIDISWAAKLAHHHGVLLNVDNCFATPYLQNPAYLGADIVTHSATKFIDGQGRTLGGAVLGSKSTIEPVFALLKQTGPTLSPFNAWVLSKSLETLHVRMDRHCENALDLARSLVHETDVLWVKYPFLESHPQQELARRQMRCGGGLLTFELKGGLARGRKFLDSLKMLSLTANLGDTRSIATHPASTTHSKLSAEERQAVEISDGLIRISVGLEHIEDILEDISQAIKTSK